ncbi:MAG: YfhO family protein [Lachnospiraceae bacterium]|nr:YfhO family protein [Lachnospiraceae bacterium]
MKEERNHNTAICAIIAFLVPVGIISAICFIYGFYPFGDKSILMADMRYQFVDYYAYLKQIASGNDDIFYTFSKTFGGDLAGLLAYYCNTPFLYLLAFVPARYLPGAILVIMIFLLGLCGLNFNIFLNKAFGFRWASLIFSTAYAFMGYLMGYFNCTHYFFDVALLPLVMLGLIYIIKKQTVSLLYILSLALSIFSSYYIGYMTCLFSVMFFAYIFVIRPPLIFGASDSFRFSIPESPADFYRQYKALILYICSSLLAVGLSSVSLLCAVFSLSGQKNSGLSFSKNLIFNPLELFSGLYTETFHGNVSDGLPLIYCGVISSVLTIMFYLNKRIEIKEKLFSLGIFLVLILSFILDPLNVAWHGFAHPIGFPHRFSFLFSFFMLFVSYSCFLNIAGAFKLKEYLAVTAVMVVYSASLLIIHNRYAGMKEIIISLMFAGASMIAINLCQYGKQYMLPAVLALFFISCLDSGINAYASIGAYFPETEDSDYTMSGYQEFVDQTGAIVDELKAEDESLYRLEKHYRRSHNDAMMFGYNGLSHFSSCETQTAKDFMGAMGFRNNGNWAFYGEEGSTTFADCFMGIRYLISQYDEIPRPFARIMEREDKYVFENPYCLPLAFAMNKEALAPAEAMLDISGEKAPSDTESSDSAEKVPDMDHFLFQNAIAGAFDGTGYDIYRPVGQVTVSTQNLTVDGNRYSKTDKASEAFVEYRFTADSDETIFMYFYAPDFQNTAIIINGLEKQPYFTQYGWNIRGLGIFGKGEEVSLKVYLKQDEIEIDGYEFYYENRDELKRWYENQTKADVEKITSSKLSGSIDVKDNADLLVFSIPYDENWSIKIDGQKKRPEPALSALLSVEVEEGEHSFEISYIPSGVKAGVPVTVISLFILGILVYKRKKML